MALVVRCPHTLQVKATRIRRRGDLVNSDQGSVDTCGPSDPPPLLASGGPSIPDPVVQPLPVAAPSTNPIAASCRGPSWTRSATTSIDRIQLDRTMGAERRRKFNRIAWICKHKATLKASCLIRILERGILAWWNGHETDRIRPGRNRIAPLIEG
jgi:hypothetical protein